MFRNLVVYCDMDGVLADFNKADPQAIRFDKEKGFFQKLDRIDRNVLGIEALVESGAKVYILSASPNKRADNDKAKWLEKNLPCINKENYIFIRIGENKADYIKERGILFDDYGKNVNQWLERGMKAFKITNDNSIFQLLAELPLRA